MKSGRDSGVHNVARALLTLLPLLAALALFLSGLSLWWGYSDARRTLRISQASVVVGRLQVAVGEQLHGARPTDDEESLRILQESITGGGGIGFAVFHPTGELAAASDALLAEVELAPHEQLIALEDGTVIYVMQPGRRFIGVGEDEFLRDESIRSPAQEAGTATTMDVGAQYIGRLPPLPRPGAGPTAPDRRGGRPPAPSTGPAAERRAGGRPPPLLPVAVRFEPIAEESIAWRFRAALAINGAGALLLVLGGVWVFNALRRRDVLMAELASKQRLSTLGAMSATLAHEIRNPLASIKGHAQLLRETAEPGGAVWAKSDRIVEESRRLEKLVSSLLEFVRTGRSDVVAADLEPLCVRAIEQSNLDGGRVRIDLSAAPVSWNLDPTQIERVLHNIVQNALAAADDGSVDVRVWSEDDRLYVSVRDHGPGVPEELMDTIFEPFVTGRLHGTGLGLSISRQLIAAHGGEIQATNPPGGGAEFRFWLAPGVQSHGRHSDR